MFLLIFFKTAGAWSFQPVCVFFSLVTGIARVDSCQYDMETDSNEDNDNVVDEESCPYLDHEAACDANYN